MTIIKTSTPYEFLARWDNTTGFLKGVHIKFWETLSEDGVLLSAKEGAPKHVSLAGEEGFPLADALGLLDAAALAASAELQPTVDKLTQQLAAANATVADLESRLSRQTAAPAPAAEAAVESAED